MASTSDDFNIVESYKMALSPGNLVALIDNCLYKTDSNVVFHSSFAVPGSLPFMSVRNQEKILCHITSQLVRPNEPTLPNHEFSLDVPTDAIDLLPELRRFVASELIIPGLNPNNLTIEQILDSSGYSETDCKNFTEMCEAFNNGQMTRANVPNQFSGADLLSVVMPPCNVSKNKDFSAHQRKYGICHPYTFFCGGCGTCSIVMARLSL